MQIVEDPPQHLLTVAEYMTLDTADRTELLDGVIYDVSPRNEPHRHAVRFLSEQLTRGLPHELMVQTQDAVAVPDRHGNDAPEVDIAVIARRRYDPIATSHDAVASIEVSHTTYGYDRKRKVPLYVKAGVPAWIVDIALRQVEFYGSAVDLDPSTATSSRAAIRSTSWAWKLRYAIFSERSDRSVDASATAHGNLEVNVEPTPLTLAEFVAWEAPVEQA